MKKYKKNGPLYLCKTPPIRNIGNDGYSIRLAINAAGFVVIPFDKKPSRQHVRNAVELAQIRLERFLMKALKESLNGK